MGIKFILTVRNLKGETVVEEHEVSGKDALERTMGAVDGLIKSWVIRDKMTFVSLIIISYD